MSNHPAAYTGTISFYETGIEDDFTVVGRQLLRAVCKQAELAPYELPHLLLSASASDNDGWGVLLTYYPASCSMGSYRGSIELTPRGFADLAVLTGLVAPRTGRHLAGESAEAVAAEVARLKRGHALAREAVLDLLKSASKRIREFGFRSAAP